MSEFKFFEHYAGVIQSNSERRNILDTCGVSFFSNLLNFPQANTGLTCVKGHVTCVKNKLIVMHNKYFSLDNIFLNLISFTYFDI